MHQYRTCIREKNSISKTDEFHGSRVFFAGEQDALWTQVTMDYVIAVTISDRLGNLPHVVTKTQYACK